MDARRLRVLVAGLPTESTTYRKLHPDWRWSNETELLAILAELVHEGNRFFHVAFLKPPHPDPLRIPRPGQTNQPEDKPKMSSPEHVKAFFGGAVRVSKREG